MIEWKFDIEKQETEYNLVKNKVINGDYDELKFYVLPTLPRMFRNRVVYLPKKFEPEKIWLKQKYRLLQIEQKWNSQKVWFEKELIKYFPDRKKVVIEVSPTLYGPIGTFEVNGKKLIIKPRYDRNVIAIQRLVINALTNYFYLKDKNISWEEKQELISFYQHKIFWKNLTMKRVIENSHSGELAEKSSLYKRELGLVKKTEIQPVDKLTKQEEVIFNLLKNNSSQLVSFDKIATELWQEKEEKYSEYAITKLIERLKKKLPKYCVHSQRGVGYVLVE